MAERARYVAKTDIDHPFLIASPNRYDAVV